MVITMSKSLSELAEDYLAEAQRIREKLSELADNPEKLSVPELNHKIAVYEDMLLDCMTTYYQMKNYYKK